jgi:pimeloyl-ACP methyl ester carboxylesterase
MARRSLVRTSVATLLMMTACTSSSDQEGRHASVVPSPADAGRADVGGYELAYGCQGEGQPTVILEAGYDSGGTSTFFQLQPQIAEFTRVCTYDRAGTGTSDPRPSSMEPVTGRQIAAEEHAVLDAIGASPPYVVVGHSYGGLLVRAFEAAYPDEVVGMVLIDASSEPEIPIYRKLHAGAWVDGGMRVDIDEVTDEVRQARLGSAPLIVLTAEMIEDEWLSTVPHEAAAAQARLATLSTNAFQTVVTDSGHFIQDERPAVVLEAILEVVDAVHSGDPLSCGDDLEATGAQCVPRGDVPILQPA